MTLTGLRPALAGAAATCAANGIARFAFVPLFPAMVVAGWVDGGQAGILGAAALAGYLVGTLGWRLAALRLGVPGTLDLGMGLIVLALAACAWNGGFLWFLLWRLVAGAAGGLLMAVAGPASQASVPPARRGAVGGIVISGVGGGIILGAILVPALVPLGVGTAWAGLAALILALWLTVRRWWPDMPIGGRIAPAVVRAPWLLLTYGLSSAGLVAPMVYLSDLLARGHGLGIAAGGLVWLLFGTGGMAGGLLSGRLIDRIGGRVTLVLLMALQSLALAICLLPWSPLVLAAAVLAGIAAIGVTTVTLSVTRELAPDAPTGLWVRCTAVFAVVQTAIAFALAAAFAASGQNHALIFGVCLAFSVLAIGSAQVLRGRA